MCEDQGDIFVFGFLVKTGSELYFLAGFNLFITRLVVADIFVSTVLSGIPGGAAAIVLGFGKKVE